MVSGVCVLDQKMAAIKDYERIISEKQANAIFASAIRCSGLFKRP